MMLGIAASSSTRRKMAIRATMMTPPASRAPPWKTSSAETLVERAVTSCGAAPGGAAPVTSRTASGTGALLAGESGCAIDLDSADELLAPLDDLLRQGGVPQLGVEALGVVGAPPQEPGQGHRLGLV